MKRLHLFEWEDLEWFPELLRNNMTDFLRNMILWQKIYEPVIPLLQQILKQCKNNVIIDLCSGAGGGIEDVEKMLNKYEIIKIKFILTDKFPNKEIINHFKKYENINYHTSPVDATIVPGHLSGIRTLFSSFHHFKPEDAKNILQDAVSRNTPIAVFEGAGKAFAEFISFLFLFPIGIFIITPFIKPFKWSRIIFTYLIPLLPFFIYWDGIVSLLRMYTPKQLMDLAVSTSANYKWEAGKIRGRTNTVTYLLGMPLDYD